MTPQDRTELPQWDRLRQTTFRALDRQFSVLLCILLAVHNSVRLVPDVSLLLALQLPPRGHLESHKPRFVSV